MLRVKLAIAAISICLPGSLAIAQAQGERARSASYHSCAAAHSASYKSSHCGKHGAVHSHSHSHAPFFEAVDGRCRDAELAPTGKDLADVRAATLCLVNRERARHGEQPLRWNDKLIAAAQAHTESMAFGGYFAHTGSNGSSPAARMREAGYIYSSHIGYEVGENIGWGSLWLGTPRAVVAAWMASPGHRANILDGRFRDTGVGVSPHLGALARGQSGGLYTQDFGVIQG